MQGCGGTEGHVSLRKERGMRTGIKLQRALDILWVLWHPGCWQSSYVSCEEQDTLVNNLMMLPEAKVEATMHTVHIAGIKLWIANFPYAFGNDGGSGPLPYRRTRYRLRAWLQARGITAGPS